MSAVEPRSPILGPGSPKPYDCLLKFLLVGDSDVGKEELLNGMDNGSSESPYNNSNSGRYKLAAVVRKLLRILCSCIRSAGTSVPHSTSLTA